MDIFEASDFDFLLPKRTRKWIAVALMSGVALLPPVRDWYTGQIEHHAQHITREIQDRLATQVSDAPPRNAHATHR